MPRKSASHVSKDDTPTARGADNLEHTTAPRRSSRGSAKKEKLPSSEERRPQRGSAASQAVASVAESRVTRSRNSTTSRKESSQSNDSNSLISKDGPETPSSRVRSSRRSTGRINYRESDGEEELPTPGNEKGYASDVSFGEPESEEIATNKKKKLSQPLLKSPSKPTSTKTSASVQNQLNSEAEESEKQRSISCEENVQRNVSVRKRVKEIEETIEKDSLQVRRSSRRTRQTSGSIEPDNPDNEVNRVPKSSANRELSKRAGRGRPKSEAEVSEEKFNALEIDTSQSKHEKSGTGSSNKRKIDFEDSKPMKVLKLESEVESNLETKDSKIPEAAIENKDIVELANEDRKIDSIMTEHESSVEELAECGTSTKETSDFKEAAPESMDIDELDKPAEVDNSDAIICCEDEIHHDADSVKRERKITSNEPSGEVLPIPKLSSESEEMDQDNHSNDDKVKSLDTIGDNVIAKDDKCSYIESPEKNLCEDLEAGSKKEETTAKKCFSESVNTKHIVVDCHILESDKSKSIEVQSNFSESGSNEEIPNVSKISLNLSQTVSTESDKSIDGCKTETSVSYSPKAKCTDERSDACVELKNDGKLPDHSVSKVFGEAMKETNVGGNHTSDKVFDQSFETSLNGSKPTQNSEITNQNVLPHSDTETSVEMESLAESTSTKANGAHSMASHAVDNILAKESSFFFPGRRYMLNPSMSEETRFSLKDRMFGFASFNLGCRIRNCSSQKDKLISELRKLQADVVCLQEITKAFFHDVLEPSLDALGYKGVIHVPEDNFTGLASFYKKATFKLSGFSEASLLKLIEKDLEASSLDPCDKTAVLSYLKKCGNVLFTQFSTVAEECTLTVANVLIPPSDISTHTLQMSCLVRELVTMIEGSTKPLLLCGAFNMAEDEAAYQLLRDGYLSNEMIEELQKEKDVKLPGKENAALINLLWKAFQHPSSNLCSCYASVLGRELLVTGKQKSTPPDLLWFSSDCLQTVGVLDVVSPPLEKTEDFHYSLKATVAFSLQRK